MPRPASFLSLFAACAAFAVAGSDLRAQTPPAPSGPAATPSSPGLGVPAKNWILPLFTPKEGFRNMTLRGTEVRPISSARIDVTDLNITIFSGDAAAHVDTMLLSPSASFFPKDQRATGEKSVRLIRDDIEVTGDGWVYEHTTKKVSLARHVRVVFSAQLNDILK